MPTAEIATQSTQAATSNATPVATPVAVLTGVTRRYGDVTALDNLSLTLKRGEIVALLGPNGAGKSTTVRLLLGLSRPDCGTVRVFGHDPRETSARERIGAMLQVGSVPRTLKVKEHIDLFRSYYPNPLAFAEVVRIAQLEGIENRLFDQLSGGQKQRLLFGLACCGNPDLIFLDEPTVGMDIEARRGLWKQIRSLAAQGKTVLLTTHYLEEADALAHRIVVVNKGRVVSEGTPDEIKARGAGRIIRCRTNLSLEMLRAMPTATSVTQADGRTTILSTHPEQVVRAMLMLDDHLSHLKVVNPGLEDAFLAITNA